MRNEQNFLSAVVKGADSMSCRREWADNNGTLLGTTGCEEVYWIQMNGAKAHYLNNVTNNIDNQLDSTITVY
jgi:hypothetical protein